jgi:deoxyribose-phosphate aldolase
MIDLSKITKKELGKLFDHSVLPKQTTEEEIRSGCKEAIQYNCAAFYSASPYWTPIVKEELAGTDILIGSGIDFPFGMSPVELKVAETEYAVKAGCTVLDMVVNIGAIKAKRYDITRAEIEAFKKAAKGVITKVILEVCYLKDDEIRKVCEIIKEVGIDYAKTSTGQFEGPTMQQFLVMKNTLEGSNVKLKVSGVKFPRPQNAYVFIMAGAELIGTRSAPEIIDGFEMMKEIGLIK